MVDTDVSEHAAFIYRKKNCPASPTCTVKSHIYLKDGGSRFLRNTGTYPVDYDVISRKTVIFAFTSVGTSYAGIIINFLVIC